MFIYLTQFKRYIGMSFKSTPNLSQIEFEENFHGTFLDPEGIDASQQNSRGYSDAFMDSNWLYEYKNIHPESETVDYPEGFVTIPINGVNWKFLWWFD